MVGEVHCCFNKSAFRLTTNMRIPTTAEFFYDTYLYCYNGLDCLFAFSDDHAAPRTGATIIIPASVRLQVAPKHGVHFLVIHRTCLAGIGTNGRARKYIADGVPAGLFSVQHNLYFTIVLILRSGVTAMKPSPPVLNGIRLRGTFYTDSESCLSESVPSTPPARPT